MSEEDILSEADVSHSRYYSALQYTKRSPTVVVKRSPIERNINNYNATLLKLWQGNMDIQYVCDPYACISYIAAYVTKDEREISQMLKNVAKELQNVDVKTKLKKVGSSFLDHLEVSWKEAAYHLDGIPLKRFNIKLIWVPSDLPEDRIRLVKPKSMLENMEDDDTDVFWLGLPDKYAARPKQKIFENMCMYELVS